ncbi:MAG: hypothetical protein OHM56_04245 [Spiroplasma phoeniceum]|nr:MAG: hypothetical protein OHM57_03645 [Spiroplasma phoeniceum]UZQ33159.1 MAG: hypothetical protein OHM56_04245 [Spiroplasma phoeniceum]
MKTLINLEIVAVLISYSLDIKDIDLLDFLRYLVLLLKYYYKI